MSCMAHSYGAIDVPNLLLIWRQQCIVMDSLRRKRYSSANTLRIQRLECGGEQLTKGPHVIRHACRQRRRALPPSGTNRAVAMALAHRQRPLQAHVRSDHMVEGLKEDHPLPHALAVFAAAGRLARQRCQG